MTHIVSSHQGPEKPQAGEVGVIFSDRTYSARWVIKDDVLTVFWRDEFRSAPLGPMASMPETLARLVLVQLLCAPPR